MFDEPILTIVPPKGIACVGDFYNLEGNERGVRLTLSETVDQNTQIELVIQTSDNEVRDLLMKAESVRSAESYGENYELLPFSDVSGELQMIVNILKKKLKNVPSALLQTQTLSEDSEQAKAINEMIDLEKPIDWVYDRYK